MVTTSSAVARTIWRPSSGTSRTSWIAWLLSAMSEVGRLWRYRSPRRGSLVRNAIRRRTSRRRPRRCTPPTTGNSSPRRSSVKTTTAPIAARRCWTSPRSRPTSKRLRKSTASSAAPSTAQVTAIPRTGMASRPSSRSHPTRCWPARVGTSASAATRSGERGGATASSAPFALFALLFKRTRTRTAPRMRTCSDSSSALLASRSAGTARAVKYVSGMRLRDALPVAEVTSASAITIRAASGPRARPPLRTTACVMRMAASRVASARQPGAARAASSTGSSCASLPRSCRRPRSASENSSERAHSEKLEASMDVEWT